MAADDVGLRYVLRGAVGGATSLLDALSRAGGSLADDAGAERSGTARVVTIVRRRLEAVGVPGAQGWTDKPLDERCRWWADRIAELIGGPVAVPRLLGPVNERVPVAAVLDTAGRALVVCAVAREIGGLDRDDQVDLLAGVLLGRVLPPADSSSPGQPEQLPAGRHPDFLRSAVAIGTTLHRAVQGLRNDGPIAPASRSRLSDRFLPVGVYRAVGAQKTSLREVATDTIDRAASPTRPRPAGSDS